MKRSKLVVLVCLMLLLIPVTVFIFGAQNVGAPAARSAREASLEKSPEDEELKKKLIIGERLVNDAIDFFNQNELGDALRAFGDDPRWTQAEWDIDVFTDKGDCFLFGSEIIDIYNNFINARQVQQVKGLASVPLGATIIDEMTRVADEGGGWVSFEWNFATNYSYVRSAVKEGTKYLIFSGIYPESPRFRIQQLVKTAIRYGRKYGAALAFQQINNPSGEFVIGDSYLWAYDMSGNNFAHGKNPALVGQNLIDLQDVPGHYRNKIMIDLVKKQGSGWIEYEENGISKYSYVEAFSDKKTGEHYIIGGGYYPDITSDTVIGFVKKAIEYLKAQGSIVALRDFSSYNGGFIKGPLRITVTDLEGNVLADALNPIYIGQNTLNIKDPEGRFFVKEMIDKVKKEGRGWVTYVENRAFKSQYSELVETPDGKFIVSAGFWPTSKAHSASTLAEKAALYLQRAPEIEALHAFTNYNTEYLKGDLFVEVYNEKGICYAYGWDRNRIWANEKKVLDQKGYPLIDKVIDTAKRGGGWTEYEMNKATRRIYTKMVTKELPHIPGEKIMLNIEETKTRDGVTRKEVKTPEKTSENFIVAVGYYA